MILPPLALTGCIGIAGAIGATARYLLGRLVAERTHSQLPWGTLLINISGAFLIGLVFTATTHHLLSTAEQSILATGFLGGYTTFSTMSWEGTQLLRGRSYRLSVVYLSSSVILGLTAVTLGFALGRVL